MHLKTYSELVPRALGPFSALKTSLTIAIDQDKIQNMISSDRTSLAPSRAQLQDDMVEDEQ